MVFHDVLSRLKDAAFELKRGERADVVTVRRSDLQTLLNDFDRLDNVLHAKADVQAFTIAELAWEEPSPKTNGCWVAKTAFGEYSLSLDDGYHAMFEPRRYWEASVDRITGTLYEAQKVVDDHYKGLMRQHLFEGTYKR